MKIVRKIEFYQSTDFCYHGYNNNPDGNDMTIELCNCYAVTGTFQAISSLEFMDTGYPESHIVYYPNYQDPTFVDDNTFDPDYTPPEINFRLHKKDKALRDLPQDEYDKIHEPIIIPPNTRAISLEIVAGDEVAIRGEFSESYAIIDDDGNEIPLDDILPSKKDQQH